MYFHGEGFVQLLGYGTQDIYMTTNNNSKLSWSNSYGSNGNMLSRKYNSFTIIKNSYINDLHTDKDITFRQTVNFNKLNENEILLACKILKKEKQTSENSSYGGVTCSTGKKRFNYLYHSESIKTNTKSQNHIKSQIKMNYRR